MSLLSSEQPKTVNKQRRMKTLESLHHCILSTSYRVMLFRQFVDVDYCARIIASSKGRDIASLRNDSVWMLEQLLCRFDIITEAGTNCLIYSSNFRLGNCTLLENLLTEGQCRFCAASMNTFPTFSDKIARQFGMVDN